MVTIFAFPLLGVLFSGYVFFLLLRMHHVHAALFELARVVCVLVCAQLLLTRGASSTARLGGNISDAGRSRILLALTIVMMIADLTIFLLLTGVA